MPSVLTLITASDCHLCAHARGVARRLAAELKAELEELDWESSSADVVRRNGVPFPPALYAGDELLGYGRISEGSVRRRLAKVS